MIVTLMGATITAGAVSGWDFTVIARYFFGGNEVLAEGVHDEINYSIVQNHLEGTTIEVVGLYADETSILVAFEINAEDPASTFREFNFPRPQAGRYLFDNSSEKWINCSWRLDSFGHADNKRTIVYELTEISAPVVEGNDYTIIFPTFSWYGFDPNLKENRTMYEGVEIRFMIGKPTMVNAVKAYPGILFDDGNTLTELTITPFSLTLSFDGPVSRRLDFDNVNTNFSLLDKDGKEISLSALFDTYDRHGNRVWVYLGMIEFKAEVLIDGLMLDYEGPIFDKDGNEIGAFVQGIISKSSDEESTVVLQFAHVGLLDIRSIGTVVFDGVVIPLE